MKILKRIIMISAIVLLLLQAVSLAAIQPVEEAPETNYNIISKKDQ